MKRDHNSDKQKRHSTTYKKRSTKPASESWGKKHSSSQKTSNRTYAPKREETNDRTYAPKREKTNYRTYAPKREETNYRTYAPKREETLDYIFMKLKENQGYLNLKKDLMPESDSSRIDKQKILNHLDFLKKNHILKEVAPAKYQTVVTELDLDFESSMLIKLKKHLAQMHFIVECTSLTGDKLFESELILTKPPLTTHTGYILVAIGITDEKVFAEPLYYFRDIDLSKDKSLIKGIFKKHQNIPYIVPANYKSSPDFFLKGNTKSLVDGDIITANILRTKDSKYKPTAILKSVISQKPTNSTSMLSIVEYDLPYQFSNDMLNEASSAKDQYTNQRNDLTHLPFVTIDGEDAKDFDDAVYVEPYEKDSYKLYVAIADVSAFVTSNSLLDKEAYKRGNSVYFPDSVVPMLPEKLSNDLCSLNPNENKSCIVAEMIINRNGEITNYTFYRSLIRSIARLTYTEVQNSLDGNIPNSVAPLMEKVINPLYQCYKKLDTASKKRNALRLTTKEAYFLFDDKNNVIDVQLKSTLEAHKIIEKMMIAANVSAAKLIQTHSKEQQIPFIYRIHDTPKFEKLSELVTILKGWKIFIKLPKDISGQLFNELLDKHVSSPIYNSLTELVLRTQQQAIYDTNNIGHFGLGLKHYSHFTSPIRRYADLIVHRVISSIINKNEKNIPYTKNQLYKTSQHISKTERIAFLAEMKAKERLLASWIKSQIGQIFDGYISSVTKIGLFINIPKYGTSGLLHIRDIGKDYALFIPEQNIIRHRNQTYKVGNPISVRLQSSDEIRGLLNFTLSS